jgi:NADH-quinone oxidoreductase subunit M
MDDLLILILLLPLLGAVIGALLPSDRAARIWALVASGATFLAAVAMTADFLQTGRPLRVGPEPGIPSSLSLPAIGFSISLSADSISIWLVLLTAFLTVLAIASSFESIRDRQREYYAWMLALLGAMNGVFVARDLLLFYIFFELTLVPMFFIIGIWGGPQRRAAAGRFFLFTFTGSIFTLAAVIYLGLHAGSFGRPSFDMGDVVRYGQSLGESTRWWLLLGLLAGFAVKVPLIPLHTWLPLAHTEAPTAGSVILAGVLLKLGTYGLLRLAVPIGLVGAGDYIGPMLKLIGAICVIGILYGALCAWVQRDIKKLVAYSSVSHLGFCVLGLVALNDAGMQGSVLYMINHGLSTGALFLVVGMIYDRYHTRDIEELSGLARAMPRLAFFFVLFALSSIGLPGLNGFVSEFLTVLGAFTSSKLGMGFGVLAALGVILGAVYMLHMVAKVIWGPLKVPDAHSPTDASPGIPALSPSPGTPGEGRGEGSGSDEGRGQRSHPPRNDINAREMAILSPIAIAVVILGLWPNPVLKSLDQPLKDLRQPAKIVQPVVNPQPRIQNSP